MGLQAVYIAITDKEWKENLQELSNEDLFEAVEDLQENDNCNFVDIGKMWDGLHFLLTKTSASEPIENNELSEFIVGVDVLNEEDFISFSSKNNVNRIIEKIEKINFNDFEEEFNPKNFHQSEIYPNIWLQENKKELFEEMKECFNELKNFYKTNKNLNIIVSIY